MYKEIILEFAFINYFWLLLTIKFQEKKTFQETTPRRSVLKRSETMWLDLFICIYCYYHDMFQILLVMTWICLNGKLKIL